MHNVTTDNLHEIIFKLRETKKATAPVVAAILGCSNFEAKKVVKYLVSISPDTKFNVAPDGPFNYDTMLTEIRAKYGELLDKMQEDEDEEEEESEEISVKDPDLDKISGEYIGNEAEWADTMAVDGYYFNKLDRVYVWYSKVLNKQLVKSEEIIKGMQRAYSNWDGHGDTINEICKKFEFPRKAFNELKKIMGWTHDSEPVTREDIESKNNDEIVRDLLESRRFEINQMYEKEQWKITEKEASKWRAFSASTLKPFHNALDTFNPKPVPPLEALKLTNPVKNTFVIGLSDLHFGSKADKEELTIGEDFNAARLEQIVDEYATQIQRDVSERNYSFSRAVLCVLGDILHSLTGETQNGTKLETEFLREAQYELAFNTLNRFITRMLQIFSAVELFVVKGNHAGPSEYILFHALSNYYRTEPRIKFNLFKSRSAVFRVENTVFILDHGASDYTKHVLPKDGAGRESYVQQILLEHHRLIDGAKSKIIIQGDKHHCEYKEYAGFEFFMFSSPVTGDKYADSVAKYSRPRQNALVINQDGVKELLSYYFD